MKKGIFSAVLCVFLITAVIVLADTARVSARSLTLQRPQVQSSYLESIAGISAWFKCDGPINLQSNLLRNQFRFIEAEGSNYLIGRLPYPADPVQFDAHVFIHSDGWVVAYFLKTDPTSIIFKNPLSPNNRLEIALAQVAEILEVTQLQVGMYHFGFPSANRIMLISRVRPSPSGTNTFTVNFPGSFEFFERSWALNPANSSASLELDGVNLASSAGDVIKLGRIESKNMVVDAPHVFGLTNHMTYWGDVFAGLAIVYRQ